jgi:hypothetical protein
MPPKVLDPRKVSSGTSYEAAGIVPVPGGSETEIGSAAVGALREVVPQLANRRSRLETYEKMKLSDAPVDVSLRAAKTPVFGAEFFMQPFSDSQEHAEQAEFCHNNIFDGQSQPFLIVLEEILRFFDNGHSVLEQVWENREWSPRRTGANRRRYTMIRKLAPRPAKTIKEFEYDDAGGPVGIIQNAIRADGKVDEVPIEIAKLIIFTLNKDGGDLEGRSLLRTAYPHWFYKTHLYKVDAIQKERHGIGFPVAKLVAGYTKKDKEAALNLVRNIRANETAGAVLPPGFDIEFKKIEGQLVNVLNHNSMIMLNAMVQFLLLGLQEGGGRATSAAHLDMFQKSLKYIANLICDTFNLYLIPKIIGYNFETYDYPRMQVRNIGEAREFQMWAAGMANLFSQEILTPDLDTEQWFRKQADMPAKMEDRPDPTVEGTTDSSGEGGQQRGDVPNRNRSGNVGKAEDEA